MDGAMGATGPFTGATVAVHATAARADRTLKEILPQRFISVSLRTMNPGVVEAGEGNQGRGAFRAKGPARECSLARDRKSTRLNSSHLVISYAVFCLKKKKKNRIKLHSTTYKTHNPITIRFS